MGSLHDLVGSLGLVLQPLVGGLLIGLAASLLWLLDGRVAGISGIAGGLVDTGRGDRAWRLCFLLGLLAGGAVMWRVLPGAFGAVASAGGAAGAGVAGSAAAGSRGAGVASIALFVVAGLLVGVGTSISSGCTSGHGVCGISRLSRRSMAATATFMATGALTALAAGALLGSLGLLGGGGAS